MQMARGKKITRVDVDDVEKRRHPSKHYVYIITVTWSDGNVSIIYRRYSKFFDFQIKLLDSFPREAGKHSPSERVIPFLPGKIIFGRSHIREVAIKRLEHINKYCKELIKLPTHISESEHVYNFFEPTIQDLVPPKSRGAQKSDVQAHSISEPVLLEQYTVLVNYKKEGSSEISLHAGETVDVIEKNETGWWFVSGEDGQGWVPSSYLEMADGDDDNNDIDNPEGQDRPHLATQPHEPEFSDELRLETGDVVEVLQKKLDGWWQVRSKGKEGLVPGSYLTRTDTVRANRIKDALKQKNPPANRNQLRSNNTSRAASGSNSGSVGDRSGSSNPDDKISPAARRKLQNNPLLVLHNQKTKDSSDAKTGPSGLLSPPRNHRSKSPTPTPSKASPSSDDESMLVYNKPPPPRKRSIMKKSSLFPPPEPEEEEQEEPVYMTIADFTNHAGDGLSFVEGADVQVIDKHENGWWYVHIDGQEGWVPSQYIKKGMRSKMRNTGGGHGSNPGSQPSGGKHGKSTGKSSTPSHDYRPTPQKTIVETDEDDSLDYENVENNRPRPPPVPEKDPVSKKQFNAVEQPATKRPTPGPRSPTQKPKLGQSGENNSDLASELASRLRGKKTASPSSPEAAPKKNAGNIPRNVGNGRPTAPASSAKPNLETNNKTNMNALRSRFENLHS